MNAREYRVKRNTVKPPGFFKRLSAVTRKQRVAATAAMPMADYEEESGSKLSGVLTVIFIIHIVVVGMIYVHQKYVNGQADVSSDHSDVKSLTLAAQAPKVDLPKVAPTDVSYAVKVGDYYGKIANELGVDEQELRVLNQHVDIMPGLTLKVPPKKIVAEEPAEVREMRQKSLSGNAAVKADGETGENVREHGLEPVAKAHQPPVNHTAAANHAKVVEKPPVAKVVAEKEDRGTAKKVDKVEKVEKTEKVVSKTAHVVKDGESIYGLAKKYKVTQEALMKANGITDPKKLRPGMKLAVPTKS